MQSECLKANMNWSQTPADHIPYRLVSAQ